MNQSQTKHPSKIAGHSFCREKEKVIPYQPGPGFHIVPNGDLQHKYLMSPKQQIGFAKRETIEGMILQKNTPGVGQYGDLRKSDFEKKNVGPTIKHKHQTSWNHHPGPLCYFIDRSIAYSPSNYQTLNKAKRQISLDSPNPAASQNIYSKMGVKKVKIQIENKGSGIPSAKHFMQTCQSVKEMQKNYSTIIKA